MAEKNPQFTPEALGFSPEDEERGKELDKEKDISDLIDRAIEIGRRQSANNFRLNDTLQALEIGAKEYKKAQGELNRELAALEIEATSLGAGDEELRRKVLKGFLDLLQKEKIASKAHELLYQEMIYAKTALDKDNAEFQEISQKIEEISKGK